MTDGKINTCIYNRLCTWRIISVRHNTYVILCNEIFNQFTSGIIVLTAPDDIVTIEVTLNDIRRSKLLQYIVQMLGVKMVEEYIQNIMCCFLCLE